MAPETIQQLVLVHLFEPLRAFLGQLAMLLASDLRREDIAPDLVVFVFVVQWPLAFR